MWYTHRKSVLHATTSAPSTEHTFSKERRDASAIFVKLFLLSFVFPMVPPINFLSLDPSRANVFTTRKSTDTERLRETLQPRLKREEYHALSLSRDVHTRGERERHTRETRREHKAHLVTQSMRVFPQRNKCAFLYRENVSVCSNIKRKQKTKQKTKETEKASILSRLCLWSALFRSS